MSKKTFIMTFAVTAVSLAIAFADVHRDPAAGARGPSPRIETTYTATVEVDSLRVLSYLDDEGVSHPADSTLIPPTPIRGPREFTLVMDRRAGTPAQVAGRVGPR